MKILVNVKTGAKKTKVMILDAKHFAVHVPEGPEKGKANDAVVKALAKHLGISPSRIILTRGERLKNKLFEIS
ncbi:MAG TPA: DUF167 domain-containing protein [Patescibacteria group bacterium]|nr:DUF167 domain-containing protein [Patescibacteria group bacterium]